MTLARAAFGVLRRPFETFASLRAPFPWKPASALFGLTLGALGLAFFFTPFLGAGTLRPADLDPAYWLLNLLPALGAAAGLCLMPAILNGCAAALSGEGGFAAGAAGTLLALSWGQLLALAIVLAVRNMALASVAVLPAALWGLWLCYAEMRALHGLSRLKSAGAVTAACLAWAALAGAGGYAMKVRLKELQSRLTRDAQAVSWPAAVQPGGQGQENAARGYRTAASLAVELTPQEADRVKSAVREGWRDPDGALASLLERDQPALEAFRRAAALPFCDFTEGTLAVITPQTPVSSQLLKPSIDLARVLTLEAMAYEARGQDDQAMDDYVAALQFAGHLARQRNWTVLYLMGQRVVVGILWRPLSDYIARDRGSAEAYARLLRALSAENAGAPGLGEAFRNSASLTAAVSAKTVEVLGRIYRPALRERMRADAQDAVAEIEDHLAASADQNTPQIWDQYMFVDSLKQFPMKKGTGAFFVYLLSHADGRAWAVFYSYTGMPRYDLQTVDYHLVRSRLNLLETGAALRAYERRYGKSPPDLQVLVPDFLNPAGADPFDSFRPYRYLPDPTGGWKIYGLGPSRKDGGGAAAYDVENSGEWYKDAADWRSAPPGEIILNGGPPSRPAPARGRKVRAAPRPRR